MPNSAALLQHREESHPVLSQSRALRNATEKHGLVCLDSTYRGLKTKHRFACVQGHVTRISPRNLIRQRQVGCRECTQIAATERMCSLAQAADSTCLNTKWRGVHSKYRFRCNAGHTWSCLGQSLLRGARCVTCAALKGQMTGALLLDGLAKLRAAAEQRGGVCLSRRYQGVQALYEFRCSNGHKWQTRGATVLYGSAWCVLCARAQKRVLSDGLERLQAVALQRGGRCLSARFEGTAATHTFECAEGHIWETSAGSVLYAGHWCLHCAYEGLRSSDGLARLQAAARERGGRCLADSYRGTLAHYAFECAEGHTWETKGGVILSGGWCPHCVGKRIGDALKHADGLAMLQAKATAQGGECLDDEYLGTHRRHRFRCSAGHEWAVKAGNILRGSWCSRCAIDRQRLTIEDARQVARERGGKCLSERYVNARSKLTWECHRGHVWQAIFDNVKNKGRWCPDCKILNQIASAKSKARLRYAKSV